MAVSARTAWNILRDAASAWVEDNAFRLSAALAFYTLLSVAPLFVIVTAVAGLAFGQEAASGQLSAQLRGLVGEAGAEVMKTAVEKADRPTAGVIATVIGVVTLLFGASGVFGELQGALNTVWHAKPKPGRGVWGFVRDRFLSFGMVLAVGFLLLVTLVVSTALAALGGHLEGLVPGLAVLMGAANFAVSFLVVAALFALMFQFLPDVRIGWRFAWFGAAVTAALFTVGKGLIALYLGRAGVATPFGAAGSLAAFVIWVYYSGLILFFGAELTRSAVRHLGGKIEPTPNAQMAGRCDPAPRV